MFKCNHYICKSCMYLLPLFAFLKYGVCLSEQPVPKDLQKGTCGKLNMLISEEETCYINSTATTCPDSSPLGTIIVKRCRQFYSSELKSITYVCTEYGWSTKGKWCQSECGLKRTGATPLIVGGEPADENEYPWIVALYRPESNLICSGTIISPYHVITGARCLSAYGGQEEFNITAIAGKYYRSSKVIEGTYQKRQVRRKAIPSNYNNIANDIGILEMDEAFNLSSAVLPICIDWNLTYEASDLQDGNKGEFAGWGVIQHNGQASDTLKKLHTAYRSSCVNLPEAFRKRYFTDDKFCCGYLNSETSPSKGDDGGGLYFKSDKKRYFLRGILSFGLGSTGKYNYQLYTRISNHLSWIREEIAKNRRFKTNYITKTDDDLTNGCFLPAHIQYGRFSIINGGAYIINKLVATSSFISLSCVDSNEDVSRLFYCQDRKWEPPIEEAKCRRPGTCSSLEATISEDVFCKLNEVAVDCNEPQTNTIATVRCQPFYSYREHRPIYKCENGTWDQKFIPCNPECGVKRVSANTLIRGGTEVNEKEYPWLVAIYDQTMEQMCAGTIIGRSFVISAAHCFTTSRGIAGNKDDYLVAGGKHFRSLDVEEASTQTSKIKTLFIHEDYRGRLQNYRDDIALIELSTKFLITLEVQPICVDWDTFYEDIDLSDGNEGVIVGWGETQEGMLPSEVQKKLVVPYVSKRKCLQGLPEDFAHEFLASDKICAGYLKRNMSGCNGDSGGGLYFRSNGGKYYIRGIISIAVRGKVGCNANQYMLFTHLSKYIPWIQAKTRRVLT